MPGTERTTAAAFAVLCVLAGGNAVGIRFSNRELEPLWGAALRFGLAALILLAVLAARHGPLPRGRELAGAALYGTLNFACALGLAYVALTRLHAGLGQTILALVPLATLLLAVAERQERMRAFALLGSLLAVAGVALMARAALRGDAGAVHVLAMLGSVVSFGQAAIVARRLPRPHPVAMNAVGMAVACVLLLAASFAAGEAHPLPRRAETWLALGYVVVAGSVLLFLLYLLILSRWAASRAVYVFVVIPAVTVLLSAWLDDEPLTVGLLLGGPLVLLGVYLGALRPGPADDRPAASR